MIVGNLVKRIFEIDTTLKSLRSRDREMHELKSMNSNLNEFQPCLLESKQRKTTNSKNKQIEALVISKDAVFKRVAQHRKILLGRNTTRSSDKIVRSRQYLREVIKQRDKKFQESVPKLENVVKNLNAVLVEVENFEQASETICTKFEARLRTCCKSMTVKKSADKISSNEEEKSIEELITSHLSSTSDDAVIEGGVQSLDAIQAPVHNFENKKKLFEAAVKSECHLVTKCISASEAISSSNRISNDSQNEDSKSELGKLSKTPSESKLTMTAIMTSQSRLKEATKHRLSVSSALKEEILAIELKIPFITHGILSKLHAWSKNIARFRTLYGRSFISKLRRQLSQDIEEIKSELQLIRELQQMKSLYKEKHEKDFEDHLRNIKKLKEERDAIRNEIRRAEDDFDDEETISKLGQELQEINKRLREYRSGRQSRKVRTQFQRICCKLPEYSLRRYAEELDPLYGTAAKDVAVFTDVDYVDDIDDPITIAGSHADVKVSAKLRIQENGNRVKCILKTFDTSHGKNFQSFRRAVHVLTRVAHPNIVALQGVCKSDNNTWKVELPRYRGTLKTWALEEKKRMMNRDKETSGRDGNDGDMNVKQGAAMKRSHQEEWEVSCAKMLRGVLEGIYALHQSNIIHRDLKPDNILIGPPRGCKASLRKRPYPALADFQTCKVE
eukprot:jgi/Bigna1/131665/aug1.15_g6373